MKTWAQLAPVESSRTSDPVDEDREVEGGREGPGVGLTGGDHSPLEVGVWWDNMTTAFDTLHTPNEGLSSLHEIL